MRRRFHSCCSSQQRRLLFVECSAMSCRYVCRFCVLRLFASDMRNLTKRIYIGGIHQLPLPRDWGCVSSKTEDLPCDCIKSISWLKRYSLTFLPWKRLHCPQDAQWRHLWRQQEFVRWRKWGHGGTRRVSAGRETSLHVPAVQQLRTGACIYIYRRVYTICSQIEV